MKTSIFPRFLILFVMGLLAIQVQAQQVVYQILLDLAKQAVSS